MSARWSPQLQGAAARAPSSSRLLVTWSRTTGGSAAVNSCVTVTAASGQLGRLVLDSLLARGVAPAEVRAGARTPDTLAEYAERGIDVVRLDYDDPATVAAAVKGVDRVLLVSGNEMGRRVDQHRVVIDAAASEGVQQLVYTSAPRADDTTLVLAPEHRATEELVRASGVPFTILRNNWYAENYAQDLATARETGAFVTSAGEGRVASAARADYAEAAAVVLTESGHEGEVYEPPATRRGPSTCSPGPSPRCWVATSSCARSPPTSASRSCRGSDWTPAPPGS